MHRLWTILKHMLVLSQRCQSRVNLPRDFLHPPRRPSCPCWPRRSRCKRTISRRFWSLGALFRLNQGSWSFSGRFWESKIFRKIQVWGWKGRHSRNYLPHLTSTEGNLFSGASPEHANLGLSFRPLRTATGCWVGKDVPLGVFFFLIILALEIKTDTPHVMQEFWAQVLLVALAAESLVFWMQGYGGFWLNWRSTLWPQSMNSQSFGERVSLREAQSCLGWAGASHRITSCPRLQAYLMNFDDTVQHNSSWSNCTTFSNLNRILNIL